MKKVLFVATITKHITTFHLPYLKLFKDNGYEVHVATDDDVEIPYCDVHHKISIKRSPFKISNIKAIKELKKICNEEKFDIIHCHTPMGSVVARLAAKEARKNGTRVIYTAHGFHFYKGAPLKNWLLFYPVEWYLSKYTDTLITINYEDFERAQKKFRKRCKDVQYVPGVGIDTKKFKLEMSEDEKIKLRESLDIKKDDFVLICVARLDKNKNQGFLIKCMQELVKEYGNIHLLLVGRDELDGYYQKLTKKLNLENNIHFLGNRNDIPQLLKISDGVVSASKREGLPVNIVEALCEGIYIVAYKCRGMEEIIQNEENGYLMDKLSKEELKNKICSIYLRKKEGKFSQKRIENATNKFDLAYTLKKLNDIYFKNDEEERNNETVI